MADEKKIAAEELTDEELDGASGGADFGFIGNTHQSDGKRKCANPACSTPIPKNPRSIYCKTCAPLFEGSGN